MSRTWAVVRRELTESVRTKTFILGTLFGPLLMAGFLFLPALLIGSGRSHVHVVIADATADALGPMLAARLERLGADAALAQREGGIVTYSAEVRAVPGQPLEPVRAELEPRIVAEEIDALLYLPPEPLGGGEIVYITRSVTNFAERAVVQGAVQALIQQQRMTAAGIDPAAAAAAMRPVPLDVRKAGADGAGAGGEAMALVAGFMGFVVYFVILIYGNAVLRGVMEEKRDKIVELILSSIRAEQLMMGKVMGIGAASMLQVLVWVVFAGLALTVGKDLVVAMGAELPAALPAVPLAVGLLFLAFFFGGFFVYAALYAAMGAIATTDQEAQQMQFPVLLPLVVGFFLMQAALFNPEGGAAFWGSLIPFTSLMVMPARAFLTRVPPLEIALSLALLFATVLLLLWAAARVYRIGILSAGKRPSPRELWRWLRAA